jgi:multicomponent K+:H+ antiporter subunit E
MSGVRALFPAPASSIVLAVFWLVLAGDVAAGQIVLAVLLGVAMPLLTSRFRVTRLPVRRIDVALRLAGVFVYDLVVANLAVARAVLGSMSRIQPRFVRVPLDIDDPAATTLLAGLVTLTPGTVSVNIDQSARTLTVHMLLVADEQAAVEQIKKRYEARIREIFQC